MAVMRRGGNTAERSENQGNTEQIGFSQEKGPGFMFFSAKTTLNQCFLNTEKPPLGSCKIYCVNSQSMVQ